MHKCADAIRLSGLAADRNSGLWGSEFASKLGQARRRLRTTLFTGTENIFVAFSCA